MRMTDRELKGLAVTTADGITIGTVRDALIDTASWAIESIEVKLDRDTEEDLGAPHHALKAAQLHLPVGVVAAVGDGITLSVTEAELRVFAEEEARNELPIEIPGYGEGL